MSAFNSSYCRGRILWNIRFSRTQHPWVPLNYPADGFIGKEKLLESAKAYGKSPYGEHLKAVAEGRVKY